MSYAIVQIQGKQYKVSSGDTITVDHMAQAVDSTITISDVLFVKTDKKTHVGTPMVPKAAVTAKVVAHEKGEKIRVATYKSKSRYRRVKGHRSLLSQLQITDIALS